MTSYFLNYFLLLFLSKSSIINYFCARGQAKSRSTRPLRIMQRDAMLDYQGKCMPLWKNIWKPKFYTMCKENPLCQLFSDQKKKLSTIFVKISNFVNHACKFPYHIRSFLIFGRILFSSHMTSIVFFPVTSITSTSSYLFFPSILKLPLQKATRETVVSRLNKA